MRVNARVAWLYWYVLTAVGALLLLLVGGAALAADPSEGTLRAVHDGEVVDVPLAHTEVRIEVSAHLADVEVVQTFHNPWDTKIDAVYLFPLPAGAAVHGMVLQIGDRRIVADIARREEAVARYERARDAGHVAALLTQERPNLFTQYVANIEPGREIDVELRYAQTLEPIDGGRYELVFPMVAPPRFVPEDSSQAHDASAVQPSVLPAGVRSSHDIDVVVSVDAGVPLLDVVSPSHEVLVDPDPFEPSRAAVQLVAHDAVPNRDFILRYGVAALDEAFGLLAHRTGEGDGSFLMVAQPPAWIDEVELTARELIFVVDVSSSMAGAPLDAARAFVGAALDGMRADDTFQIVAFDQAATALGPDLLAQHPANHAWAREWMQSLRATGGTDVRAGITRALAMPHDPLRLRVVVFLTDGYIGNEDEVLADVAAQMGDARLFAFGVGSAVNRYLLEEMAALGRGEVAVVTPSDDADVAAAEFHGQLARPVLTDLRVDWGELPVSDVTPSRVGDLFAGRPLVLAGHYEAPAEGIVTVHARRAGLPVRFDLPVSLPAWESGHASVPVLWARRRVTELTRHQLRGETLEAASEITRLGLEHHLMTRYTALVAVDESLVTDGESQIVPVPVEVPAGLHKMAHTAMGMGMGMGMGMAGVGYAGGDSGGYGVIHGMGKIDTGGSLNVRQALAVKPVAVEVLVEPSVDLARASVASPTPQSRRRADLQTCYESRLQAHPGLAGKVVLTLRLDASGDVSDVSVAESTVEDDELLTCVVDRARRWTMADVETTVEVPFVFSPGE